MITKRHGTEKKKDTKRPQMMQNNNQRYMKYDNDKDQKAEESSLVICNKISLSSTSSTPVDTIYHLCLLLSSL